MLRIFLLAEVPSLSGVLHLLRLQRLKGLRSNDLRSAALGTSRGSPCTTSELESLRRWHPGPYQQGRGQAVRPLSEDMMTGKANDEPCIPGLHQEATGRIPTHAVGQHDHPALSRQAVKYLEAVAQAPHSCEACIFNAIEFFARCLLACVRVCVRARVSCASCVSELGRGGGGGDVASVKQRVIRNLALGEGTN